MTRYIVKENATAIPQYIQNRTIMTWSSQDPVWSPTPYCVMLTRIVPMLMITEGMKSDSVGCKNESLKVSGQK
jgi:hypothetical protein